MQKNDFTDDVKDVEMRIASAIERLSTIFENFSKIPSQNINTQPTDTDTQPALDEEYVLLHEKIASLEKNLAEEKNALETLKATRKADLEELDRIIARFTEQEYKSNNGDVIDE